MNISDPVTRELSTALGKTLGGAASELSEYLADRVRFLRWQSAIKTLHRAREIADREGGLEKVPPLKFLVPFLEGCSLEEEADASLRDMWARLLVSSAESDVAGHLLFLRILREITSTEANCLNYLMQQKQSSLNIGPGYFDGDLIWDYLVVGQSRLADVDCSGGPVNIVARLSEMVEGPGVAINHLVIAKGRAGQYPYDSLTEEPYPDYEDHIETKFGHAPLQVLKSLNLVQEANGEINLEKESYVVNLWIYYVTTLGALFYDTCVGVGNRVTS